MGKSVKEKLSAVIRQERKRLEKERDYYTAKMHDTEEYWGCGGPYARQEAAKVRREMELVDLADFESQLKTATRHIHAGVYFFGCRKCGAVTITTKQPFSDWHECPACRRMINLSNVPSTEIRIADDGQWTALLMEALKK